MLKSMKPMDKSVFISSKAFRPKLIARKSS